MEKINLLISHKNEQSRKTLSYLEKFENFSEYVNVLSIHDNKEFIRKSNIKKVPSIMTHNRIIEGHNQCCLFLQSFINSRNNIGEKKEQPNSLKPDYEGLVDNRQSGGDVKNFESAGDVGNFANIGESLPMFANISEPMNNNNTADDLASQMERYKNSAPQIPPQN